MFWPTRPKPQITTCSRSASGERRAPSRAIASLDGGPCWPSSGTRDAPVVANDERRQHHAEHGRGEQRLHDGWVEQFAPAAARSSSANPNSPPWPDHDAGAQCFEPTHCRRLCREGDHCRLEQRACRRESPSPSRKWRSSSSTSSSMPTVMKNRPSSTSRYERIVGLDLVTKLGLGEHHSGEKGAERERQADGMGRPGRRQHRQQHRRAKTTPAERTEAMTRNSGRSSHRPGRQARSSSASTAMPTALTMCARVGAAVRRRAAPRSRARNSGKLRS